MSPRKANGFGRSLRVILSLLNLHHSVKGPYKPDMVKQVAAATADVVTPEKARFDFWKAGLGLACYAINKKLSSNLGPLLPTGQQTAPRPGFNCSWAEFVSTDAFQLLAGFDHKLTPQKLARKKFLTSGSFMGNLTFIGETGGKTRTILVAHPVLQCQLRYLKDQLLELLRSIPTDTMWDQNRGVEFIKEAQRVGKTIYSVDLKDATWNFPRSLQEEVLRKLGVKEKVRDIMFRTLVYDPLSKSLRKVEKGQAMGLGPSFPLFSLTHNLVLLFICKWLGRVPIDSFRILGDDVVITDSSVYELYLQFLMDFGVPVSKNKSFISLILGEFAGRIIWRGIDITPIKWKWLDWNSISSLYWSYRSLGIRLSLLMRSKKAWVSLNVLGPLPKRFGGLSLKASDLFENQSINRLRVGVLESIEEGLTGKQSAFGVHKISNQDKQLDVGPFDPLVDYDALKALDTLLVDDSIYHTAYGILPLLSPNPSKTLSQLGISMNLIPLRKEFELEEGFRFRFRRAKSTDWKLKLSSLDSLEVSLDIVKEKSPVSKEENNVNLSFFQ
jgi:hypothetical protein